MPFKKTRPDENVAHIKRYRTVSLVLTRDCNLHCQYCYEKHDLRDNKIMEISVAKDALSKYISESADYEGVEIDFFGGEPLLAFPLIKEILEWHQTVDWNKECRFLVGTNGTLLNDDMKDWFTLHKNDVYVSFSIDGTKIAHDLNRSNSYDKILPHFSFFKKNWPNQPAKMTISAETIPYVAESVIELEELGFMFTANIGFEDIWGNGANKKRLLKIYAGQLEKLVDYYASHPHLYPVSPILDALPEYLGLPDYGESKKKEIKRFCGAGHEMVVVDVDGTTYPCHRFLPWVTRNPEIVKSANCQNAWKPDKCAECKLSLSCPTCAGFNWELNHDSGIRTTYHCESYKIEVLASAKLEKIRLQQIANNLTQYSSQKQKQIKSRLNAVLDLIDNGI